MNKPFADPLSDLVRTCPEASQNVPREEESRREKTPPTPPQAGGRLARVKRARAGSRRRRDLEALQEREPIPVPVDVIETADARATWRVVVALAESSPQLRPDVIDAWLRPARVAGERNGRVVIAAPPRISERLRRRFGAWLGEAVRSCSAHTGIEIYDDPDEQPAEVTW